MAITDFNKINNDFLYINYKKYPHKIGDLDLLHSGGLMGNSVMNFGLFYYELKSTDDYGVTRFLLDDEIFDSERKIDESR